MISINNKDNSDIKNLNNLDFQEIASRLQISNNELHAFNYTISHEIKAPVRAIDGYARIFIEDYKNTVAQEGIELIQNIRGICSDTLILINKLLEYTRFTDFEPILEALDLKEMVKAVFDELVIGYSKNQKMILRFEDDIPFILADKVLMKQVITNIISNSLKFTRNVDIGIITVGYLLVNNENRFYIRDNGVGFDMKFSENLFGMFQRMHSINDFEGSGVGLAIVKKIIEKSGGRVWITGEVGIGACVYFTISQENILK
ncbi:sensor histidine kinase [Ruminiclostridium cellobioparum]|uniref:histidine kinase n=1 Tax=Ruminiclostridium cellobioparum subsp. termitidis CT1112 TaxID=1195236 RepID=S0FIH2_RUMCE|nr:ATP-binding protein [Ruminiclostridium cellobioparum]EMS71775.1 Bacteriophytochrome (light-regulated signal transduction histidine kinase) [Ruminiclostridium cellobioparum subsp. termitidis CT1112]